MHFLLNFQILNCNTVKLLELYYLLIRISINDILVGGIMKHFKKEYIWILIPFIYGYLSNYFLFIINPLITQIVFGVFWFWVGIQFAKLDGHSVKNFLVGNSLWLTSFVLFLWQFILMNDESRNTFLAGLSQHYMFSFIWSGTSLTLLLSDTIYGTMIMVYSYLFMLLIFGCGFIFNKLIHKNS